MLSRLLLLLLICCPLFLHSHETTTETTDTLLAAPESVESDEPPLTKVIDDWFGSNLVGPIAGILLSISAAFLSLCYSWHLVPFSSR